MACDVTYEELAGLVAGDLDAQRGRWLQDHGASCPQCSGRIAALRGADGALRSLRRAEAPAHVLWRVRRALARELGGGSGPEVMTLEEVARFLRVRPEQLAEDVADLPAFESAGEVRVRRSKLIEWIQTRERAYARRSVQSTVARIVAGTLEVGGHP